MHTVKEMAVLLKVSETAIRRLLKIYGYIGELNRIRGGRIYKNEVLEHLKSILSPKIQIIEVPRIIEVHNNYYIYESKINKL